MPPVLLDRWDSASLTDVITRPLTTGRENGPSLAEQIAPLNPVRDRSVKFRVIDVDAFGVGRLRAPGASPRLWRTTQRLREEMLELALPDEMEHVNEDIIAKLNSTDELIQMTGGVDLVTRGRVLAERNRRKIEQMRWSAFLKGYVDLDYEDSGERITYPIPASNFIDVSGSGPWTTLSTDIITQMRGWQKQLADTVGVIGTQIHMNSDTWEYVFNNTVVRTLLSSWGRSILIPSGAAEVASLLRGGIGDEADNPPTTIKIYDVGYKDVGSDLYAAINKDNTGLGNALVTRWLPSGTVLVTTSYVIPNVGPIADTPSGMVRIKQGDQGVWVQGPAAENITDPYPPHDEILRYASAAIPRLLIPEAFLIAKVY